MLLSFHPFADARTAPFHPQIHNVGNTGVGGAFHARCALAATAMIDHLAYGGRDMRAELAARVADETDGTVLDVGCGVGTMTKALCDTERFSRVVGIDTSQEMLHVARQRVPTARFLCANGVDAARVRVDAAVVSMVMHEAPPRAHREILTALFRAAPIVYVADISPAYTPSASMLMGEPYVQTYQKTFQATADRVALKQGRRVDVDDLVTGHVRALDAFLEHTDAASLDRVRRAVALAASRAVRNNDALCHELCRLHASLNVTADALYHTRGYITPPPVCRQRIHEGATE